MRVGFSYDIPALYASGGRLAGEGERLAAALERLGGEVVGSGSPWGADEFGTIFAIAYGSITELAFNRIGALAERLHLLGDSLTAVADGVEAADADSDVRLYFAGPPA